MAELTILKAVRQAAGVKLSDLPEHGISKWTYTFIENGQNKANRKIRDRIGKLFGVKSKYLFDKQGNAIFFSKREVINCAIRKRKREWEKIMRSKTSDGE